MLTIQDVKNASVQYRELEKIQEQDIYTIKVKVKKGRRTKALKWEYLGLTSAQIEALNEYKSSPGTIRLVEIVENECQQGGNQEKRLNKLISELKNEYLVYFPPHYFFTESQIGEVTEILNKILEEEARIKEKVSKLYETEKEKQEYKIREQIQYNPYLNAIEIDQIVALYMAHYPTEQEILNSFGIEIEYIQRVPSLKEQAKTQTELAKWQQEQKELKTIEDLQEEYKKNIQEKLNSATAHVVNEAIELINESMEKIETLKSKNKNFTNERKKNIRKAVERVERLAKFNGGLADIAQSFSKYAETEMLNPQGNILNQEIKEIKQNLQLELQQVESAETGHKSLSAWL